jgi:hypothetical protein
MSQHFIHRTETTNQNSKVNHDDSKMLIPDSVFSKRQSCKTLPTVTGIESRKAHNMEVIENFETFP